MCNPVQGVQYECNPVLGRQKRENPRSSLAGLMVKPQISMKDCLKNKINDT